MTREIVGVTEEGCVEGDWEGVVVVAVDVPDWRRCRTVCLEECRGEIEFETYARKWE